MTKKAIIFDLDNTIYSVPSVADDMLSSLFELIQKNGDFKSSFSDIKHDILRKPFHVVAEVHGFSETLMQQGIQLLQTMTYNKPIEPFADYTETKDLALQKYLVTTGFVLLQNSKIKGLKIENDFKEIYVVDITKGSKKEVFADIIKRHHYKTSEVIVVGDDPQSEIKAASDLGIDAVLYDKFNLHQNITYLPRITDYKELKHFL